MRLDFWELDTRAPVLDAPHLELNGTGICSSDWIGHAIL